MFLFLWLELKFEKLLKSKSKRDGYLTTLTPDKIQITSNCCLANFANW